MPVVELVEENMPAPVRKQATRLISVTSRDKNISPHRIKRWVRYLSACQGWAGTRIKVIRYGDTVSVTSLLSAEVYSFVTVT